MFALTDHDYDVAKLLVGVVSEDLVSRDGLLPHPADRRAEPLLQSLVLHS